MQAAVDDANALNEGAPLKLEVFNTAVGPDGAVVVAQRIADDPAVLAVVVQGEEGVAKAPMAVFKQAHLAVIAASSWAQPRPAEAYATWLSPGLTELAGTAALFAKREGHRQQIAVVDDGSATSTAAVKAFAGRYRALGGKVAIEATWAGDESGLSDTVKALDVHWPQMVFYAGNAESAGRLVLAMKGEKALKNADLFGLPPLFDSAFFETTGLKGMRTRAVFPCPDYDGMGLLVRDLGFAFPRTSPQYRAYLHFAFRHPGRWTSMLYDGAALAARAVRIAQAPMPMSPSPEAATGTAAVAAVNPSVSSASAPTREAVRVALLNIGGYRGIRGDVKFNAAREPTDAKALVYFALNRVNRKEMLWKQRAYGPPF